MLAPVIAQTSRSIVNPAVMGRIIPFIANVGDSRDSQDFTNQIQEVGRIYEEQKNQQRIVNQDQVRRIAGILQNNNRISMAPMPRQDITIDDIKKTDTQIKLSKIPYNQREHGTYEQFQKKINDTVNNIKPTKIEEQKNIQDIPIQEQTPLIQQIADLKEKLRKNNLEEGKSDDDPIYQKVLQEKAQLIKKLADLSKKRNQERNAQKVAINEEQKVSERADQKSFTEDELNEIQQFSDLMRRSNISEAQQEIVLQDIQANGLLPFDHYDKYDARNYLRNPNKKGPSNEPYNEPDNEPDNNDDQNEAMKQAAMTRISDIINQKDNSDQRKLDDLQTHINTLSPTEFNILFNIYNINSQESQQKQQTGHLDADSILSSLIE